MNLLFKFLGFALILITTSLLGFLKSGSLKMRQRKLVKLKNSINDLKQHIRLSNTEIDKLISICFGNVSECYSDLEKSDIELMDNFLKDIGMSDSKTEYDRCELYISLIDKQILEAEKNYSELSGLYKSVGFLCGIFICIFFL